MLNNANGMDDPADQHFKMVFEDLQREQALLVALNEQRKTGKFCDMLVKVGDSEIFGHRSVLSISIPQIFEDVNHNSKKVADNLVVELKGLDPRAVEKLIEFSYTARIEMSVSEVTKLFLAARSLGLTEVENAARRFIEEKLLPFNWLSVRTFAQRNNCVQLLTATEMFLRENFSRICHGKDFMSLPRLQVELTGRQGQEGIEGEEICKTVVSWAKKQLQEEDCNLSKLLEQTYIMYLTPDKKLKECVVEDLDDENKFVATEAQKEYIRQKSHEQAKMEKITSQRMENGERIALIENAKNKKKRPLSTCDNDLHLIAACQSMESDCVGVAGMGDEIVALSVHVHQQLSTSSMSESSDSSSSEEWTLIAPMSRGRCGVGAADLGGKLYAVGGYDRGDCLELVECYDPATNAWMQVKSLGCHRGRFELVVLNSQIYAVGGSDGHLDLKSVECYDPETNRWTNIAQMRRCRSSLGVAVVDDLMYAVGGQWENKHLGVAEVYNPVEEKWSEIPPMNVERSNLCVAALNGKIYAIGGFNGWSCYSSVECYDPGEGIWSFVKPMTIPRRGAGAIVLDGLIYVIGGSDGTSFLNSLEYYNPETNEWSLLAGMDTPRQNVGVTVLGNHIYAVGGFSGSAFLKTVEYYDTKRNKWNSFVGSQ